jgi:hypothetical protein
MGASQFGLLQYGIHTLDSIWDRQDWVAKYGTLNTSGETGLARCLSNNNYLHGRH